MAMETMNGDTLAYEFDAGKGRRKQARCGCGALIPATRKDCKPCGAERELLARRQRDRLRHNRKRMERVNA